MGLEQAAQVADRAQGAWVLVAQRAAESLQRLAQERLGIVELALGLEQAAQVVDRGQGGGVLVAQRAAEALQPRAQERIGFVELALGRELGAQVDERDQGVWVLVAQRAAESLQRLAEERIGFVELAPGLEQVPQVVDRGQGVWILVAEFPSADLERLLLGLHGPLQESQFPQRAGHRLQELRLHEWLLLEVLQSLERPSKHLLVQYRERQIREVRAGQQLLERGLFFLQHCWLAPRPLPRGPRPLQHHGPDRQAHGRRVDTRELLGLEVRYLLQFLGALCLPLRALLRQEFLRFSLSALLLGPPGAFVRAVALVHEVRIGLGQLPAALFEGLGPAGRQLGALLSSVGILHRQQPQPADHHQRRSRHTSHRRLRRVAPDPLDRPLDRARRPRQDRLVSQVPSQIRRKLRHGGVAPVGILLQRLAADHRQVPGHF